LPNSGPDSPHGADTVPQVPGPGGRFRCEGTRGALQAVQGPGRQGPEQDSQGSTERQEAKLERGSNQWTWRTTRDLSWF